MMSVVAYKPGGCSPELGNAIIFQANAKFLTQKPAAKKFKNIFWYLLNEQNGIHSVLPDNCLKYRIFTNNYWMGRVEQRNFAP